MAGRSVTIDENRIKQDFRMVPEYQNFQYKGFDTDGEEKRDENRSR